MQRHIDETLRHSRDPNRKLTYKENWIMSLLNQNIYPDIVIIEELNSTEKLDKREPYWIAHYRSIGQCECNHKDGAAFSIRNLKEFWARRNKELGRKTTDEKKAELLNLPEGSPRYTTASKGGYDEEFDKKIRAKFPHWFNVDHVFLKKQNILQMPIESLRPNNFPVDYISKNKSAYDENFDKEIREKFPHWFADMGKFGPDHKLILAAKERSDKNKIELLALPDAAQRPHVKTKLGRALCCYTSANKDSFDSDFNKAIRTKFPRWFKEDRVAENMQALLNIPEGSPKPRKDCALGQMLRNYTNVRGKSYRAEFDQAIRTRPSKLV